MPASGFDHAPGVCLWCAPEELPKIDAHSGRDWVKVEAQYRVMRVDPAAGVGELPRCDDGTRPVARRDVLERQDLGLILKTRTGTNSSAGWPGRRASQHGARTKTRNTDPTEMWYSDEHARTNISEHASGEHRGRALI